MEERKRLSDYDPTLSTATMDEIVEEIRRRNASSVIITIRDHKTDKDTILLNRWYGGGKVTAIGLCEAMKASLLKVIADEAEDE